MHIAIIWFSVLSLFSTVGREAIPEAVVVKSAQPVSINSYLKVYKSDRILPAEEAWQLIRSGEMEAAEDNVSPGFSSSYYWLWFNIENNTGEALYLELANPHMDFVDFYRLSAKGPELIESTGDKRIFDTRSIKNRRFVFSLGGERSTQYLMMLDKRGAAISFPLKVWGHSAFAANENKANLLFGIYLGIVFFVGLFSLLVGLSLRDSVFFTYGIYVALFSMYIFTNLGFSFQYVYPNSSELNSYSRIILANVMVIAAVEFFRRFLYLKKYLPRLDKAYVWVNVLLWTMLIIGLSGKFLWPDGNLTTYLLRLFYLIIFGIIASSVVAGFMTWRQQPGTAMLFLAAFSFLSGGSAIFILIEFGVLPETNFPLSPVLLGSIGEILVLSASMVYRVKYINDKKNELMENSAQQQKDLMKAFLRGGEKERSRISAELHDNIGSNLSLLKAKINRMGGINEEVNVDIDRLCGELRDLSHQLMPHAMEITGLEASLKEYCEKYQSETGIEIDLEFYSFPKLPQDQSFQLYRIIQEALQNIWKHSGANLVEIQMVGYDDEVVVTVDDNGVGFDANFYIPGNGLLSMRSRIEASEGCMELVSYPGKGTNLMFKMPISKTE